MTRKVFMLPAEIVLPLERMSGETGMSQGEIVRRALQEYLIGTSDTDQAEYFSPRTWSQLHQTLDGILSDGRIRGSTWEVEELVKLDTQVSLTGYGRRLYELRLKKARGRVASGLHEGW